MERSAFEIFLFALTYYGIPVFLLGLIFGNGWFIAAGVTMTATGLAFWFRRKPST